MNPVTARTESMTGQDSACLQMPASLRTSQQRCNNVHKAVVAQNQLTWQTLIHILTFLKARAKGEGTDTPIFVLYFFLLEQSSQGTFPNSAASGQRGDCRCMPFQNQRGFYWTTPDHKERLDENTAQFKSLI